MVLAGVSNSIRGKINLLLLNIILEFYHHAITFADRKNIKGNKCLQYSS